jgi:hypothetical protein
MAANIAAAPAGRSSTRLEFLDDPAWVSHVTQSAPRHTHAVGNPVSIDGLGVLHQPELRLPQHAARDQLVDRGQ